MKFCCNNHRVLKARKLPPKVSARARRAARERYFDVAMRVATPMRASLIDGVTLFKDRIKAKQFVELFAAGDLAGAFTTIPWKIMEQDLDQLFEMVARGYNKGALKSFEDMPRVLRPTTPFSLDNARVSRYITVHTGELITAVKQNTQDAVKEIIRRSWERGLPPRAGAKLVKNVVGLTGKFAIAVDNYRSGLMEKDVPLSKIESLVDAYSERLLGYRAEMIARTESVDAVNEGQMEIWHQAIEDGVISHSQVRKQWVVDPGTACPEICEPMDGQTVPLDADFVTGLGEWVSSPTAHPNCNCDVMLVYVDE